MYNPPRSPVGGGGGYGMPPPRSPAGGAIPSAPPPEDPIPVQLRSTSAYANPPPPQQAMYGGGGPPPPMFYPPQQGNGSPMPMNGAVGAPIAVTMPQSPVKNNGSYPGYAAPAFNNGGRYANHTPGGVGTTASPSSSSAITTTHSLIPVRFGAPGSPRGHWPRDAVDGAPPGAVHGALPPSASASPTPPPMPSSVVELRFRCKNLKTADVFSESDPFIVVYMEETPNQWRELGRTETVTNSANPTFTTAIEVDYYFEEVQRLRLEIFDRDSKSETLSAHDFLGCVELTMAQLMSSAGQSMVLALLQAPHRRVHGIQGHVVIDAEELSMCADQVAVQFAADKVDNKDGWFGKSDPFLNIYRLKDEHADIRAAASWIHVWRSPVIMDNLNPRWPKVTLGVRTLCNGNLQRRLKFECMDWEASGRHQFIGHGFMTAAEFVAGERLELDLINPERQQRKGKKYKNSGVLRILSHNCFKLHTFAEFLRGGCEISLMVGIDYTASNGAVSDPSSLHYMGGSAGGYYGQQAPQPNEYQAAIQATGQILEPYDHDRRFPVYGFGAIVNGQVNHCFPLTFDPSCPEVEGVQGILQAYANSFPFLQLHGPTHFAPLIRQAAAITRTFSQAPAQPGCRQNLKYFVLLILTDGVIMDMDATVEEIVLASELPLSIVIVGVGHADFSAMDALDADGKLLRGRSGRVAKRDIVQFVPFNRFRSNPARLAKETLAEIPLQLTQHFHSRGIRPNPPLQRAGTEALIANAVGANRSSFTSSSNAPNPAAAAVAAPTMTSGV